MIVKLVFVKIFNDKIWTNITKKLKKIQVVNNRFKEFNSRFFTQVLYFINHANLKKDINVLEVGPNSLGILPTLKIFQKK